MRRAADRRDIQRSTQQHVIHSPHIDRRGVLKSAGYGLIAAVALVALPDRLLSASMSSAMAKLVGGRTPEISPRVVLKVPSYIHDGAIVPMEIFVDSPMTENEHVRQMHLVAEGNPIPHVASFTLSREIGLARVRTRIRLEQKQMVVGLAELNDGRVLMTKAEVEVALAGCSR